ncbi:MAG: hypothetical protein HQL37_13060 [Alphaproteobacteria bacterium]|nr:hypothetical protein [Alphaproteobacteria bacterium]
MTMIYTLVIGALFVLGLPLVALVGAIVLGEAFHAARRGVGNVHHQIGGHWFVEPHKAV